MPRLIRLLGIIALAATAIHTASAKPPNIIIFLADDLGWTGLRSFGSDFYDTPNLDRLAAEGMKFTDAYAACTVCSPTRASLMTGMYPARLHLTSFIPGQNRPFAKMNIPDWTKGLKADYTTLPEALRNGGYRTIHVGKWHLNFPDEPIDPTQHGFDFSSDKPAGTRGYYLSKPAMEILGTKSNYLTDHLADVAVDQINQSTNAPFFLYLAFHVPHTPIQGRDDLVKAFEQKADPQATHHNPTYAAMVKSMDIAVGRVLDAVAAQGLTEETIVIFTSDNGGLTQRYGKHDDFTENLPLRLGKGSAYEGGVRVPAIVKWPHHTTPGSTSEDPIMTIDLYPTLLDIAGIEGHRPHTAKIDGVSIKPLLLREKTTLDRDLFWHFPHYHAGGHSPYSAIRSGNLRLVEFHEDGALELYDLAADIGESNDLTSSQSVTAEKLHQKLRNWRKSVGAQMPTPNPNYDPARASEVVRQR